MFFGTQCGLLLTPCQQQRACTVFRAFQVQNGVPVKNCFGEADTFRIFTFLHRRKVVFGLPFDEYSIKFFVEIIP